MKIQIRGSTHLARRGFLQTVMLGVAGVAMGVQAARVAGEGAADQVTAQGRKVWRLVVGPRGSDNKQTVVAYVTK